MGAHRLFLDVLVNNNRARHVYKAFGLRKVGTMRDPSGCRAEGWADFGGRRLLLLAIHSGVPGILSTETRKKKLAEEG